MDAQPGKEHLMDPNPPASTHHYKSANNLVGKVALVTRGDSGIGRAVAHCFALEGATHADAKDPLTIPTDLGYDDTLAVVVDEVVNSFGRIDILINNAAEQYEASSVEEIDKPRLERVFRTNIFSCFFTTRHALKHMKEGSCIINTTSVIAYKGNPKLLDYTATKGAIVDTRERGWTPLIPPSFTEDESASFGKEVPMGRAGQPHEVAPAYVFLACNVDSSYITGQVIHPNGGSIVNG
ncbi:hypothetical protein SASPL_157818 [Salvia splendens]|uniref:NAD(P)-binding protein n=1 Tax=Salvia splendens TaxID=180675 RepID=A0A8X8YUC2_SALSN|nr:hypothetical protein SASPL_157818 [Salvia splendens]